MPRQRGGGIPCGNNTLACSSPCTYPCCPTKKCFLCFLTHKAKSPALSQPLAGSCIFSPCLNLTLQQGPLIRILHLPISFRLSRDVFSQDLIKSKYSMICLSERWLVYPLMYTCPSTVSSTPSDISHSLASPAAAPKLPMHFLMYLKLCALHPWCHWPFLLIPGLEAL